MLQSDWLTGTGVEVTSTLLSIAEVIRVRRGHIVPGSSRSCTWFGVARGVVAHSAQTAVGKRVIVSLVEPGAWFGESVVHDGKVPVREAHACADSTLLCIPQRDLYAFLRITPEFGIALARMNGMQARRMEARFTDAVTLSLEQRLLSQLLLLARRFGIAAGLGIRIPLTLSQQDLADMVGISRQRTNVTLAKLRSDGLVQWSTQGMTVPSLQKLEQAAASASTDV